MFEDFINALQNFRINKMRTLLSLLGIVIGVMSVVIITTLSQSLSKSISAEFERFSLDTLTIRARWNPDTKKQWVQFTEEYRNTLMQKIPKIKNIFYTNDFNAKFSKGNTVSGNKQVYAVEPDRLEAMGLQLDYGAFFSLGDYAYGLQKAVIGKNIAEELFPEGRAVGKTVTLQISSGYNDIPPYNFQFEVIGVLKDSQSWMGASPAESVFIPRQFYKHKLMFAGMEARDLWSAEVKLLNSEDIEYVQAQILLISKELANGFARPVWVFSAKEQLNTINKVVSLVGVVMTAVAAISLLVGGIGIMNIMLVTITERRKEIGIRKALGATKTAIRNQFLVESAALTLTGGVIGVGVGLVISNVIAKTVLPMLAENPNDITVITAFDIQGIIISFAVSVSIGIFFGLHPALKAAKLDPVEALAD
ncbi:ABC transporter permease [Treponema pedis]|uniref:ABC transporter permease n=1 Tax=Treponema pedis TaxID=409322 RepID=UPI000416C3BB|nr:ABC transporter permease [Treponema pedis]